MPLTLQTCLARNIGDRGEQQDRVALFAHPTRPGLMMAVLADGMGGHSGGAVAAEQVVLRARQNFESYAPQSETAAHLLEGIIKEAHLVIKLTRFTSEQDPHSTAVVLMLQPGRADWVHCGDSRLYHFRGAELVTRSEDHSLVNELLRTGKIDTEAALNHPQRNVLLSCLGSERDPEIAHGEQAGLQVGDSFLICSDGLWGYLSDAELGHAVDSMNAREAAQHLVSLARQRGEGHGDNITVVIVKLIEATVDATVSQDPVLSVFPALID
jgi:PPM family protein phosphatase